MTGVNKENPFSQDAAEVEFHVYDLLVENGLTDSDVARAFAGEMVACPQTRFASPSLRELPDLYQDSVTLTLDVLDEEGPDSFPNKHTLDELEREILGIVGLGLEGKISGPHSAPHEVAYAGMDDPPDWATKRLPETPFATPELLDEIETLDDGSVVGVRSLIEILNEIDQSQELNQTDLPSNLSATENSDTTTGDNESKTKGDSLTEMENIEDKGDEQEVSEEFTQDIENRSDQWAKEIDFDTLRSHLWEAADILRGSIDAADYKNYIFGLLFLKRINDRFEEKTEEIAKECEIDEETVRSDHELHAEFWVPNSARWDHITAQDTDIGATLNKALEAIEDENDTIDDRVLTSVDYSDKDRLNDAMLEKLIIHFTKHRYRNEDLANPAIFGLTYEYLVRQFADDAEKTAHDETKLEKFIDGYEERAVLDALFTLPENQVEFKPASEIGVDAVILAREAVESYVKHGQRKQPDSIHEALYECTGAFVRLESTSGRGGLRGRAGGLRIDDQLRHVIVDAAITAASEDSCGSEVSPSEFPNLIVSVCIVRNVVLTNDPLADLEIGTHGVAINNDSKSGWLCPNVPVENNWSASEYLDRVCRMAELPPGAWKDDDTSITLFQGDVFRESEPGEEIVKFSYAGESQLEARRNERIDLIEKELAVYNALSSNADNDVP